MEAPEQSQILAEAKKESNLGLKGIVEVFYQPAKLFERIKDEPKILVPWIFFFLLIFSFIYLVSDLMVELQMEVMREKITDQGLSTANLPSEAQIKW